MNSSHDRFQAVWDWHRVAVRAIDVFENEVKQRPESHVDTITSESPQVVLSQIGGCRDEFENFALLSLWALFEEAINDWLTQRVQWASVVPELDEGLRKGLSKRVQHWSITEKIDALKTLIGEDVTKNLHAVRKWRDWVAHRKAGARPAAVDLEMAQSLLIAALTRLEMCPIGQAKALS